MGARRAVALCHCFNGALEYQAGRWFEAESSLKESIQLYRALRAKSGEALAWQRLGVLYTAWGRVDDGLQALQEGIIAAEQSTMRAHCLSRVYAALVDNRLAAGDLPAAGTALDLGLSMKERHGNCATCNGLLLPAAVAVRCTQDRLEEAHSFSMDLNAAAREYQSQAWVAMAHQTQAVLEVARNNFIGAVSLYRQASDEFEAAGNRYEAARCLLAAASLDEGLRENPQVMEAQQFLDSLGILKIHLPVPLT